MAALARLEVALIHDNDFTGTLPEEIGFGWTSVFEIHLFNNLFEGTIPASFATGMVSLGMWQFYFFSFCFAIRHTTNE